MAINYTYDGKFKGNILVVGQTGCGKTTFIQKLAVNKLFGKLNKIFWISKITLSSEREKNILPCFQQHVDFKYLQKIDKFNMHLKFLQRKKHIDNDIDIVMGENKILDKLIVIGSVLGLPAKSDDFANFLTMTRKFNFTCVNIFHMMYPTDLTGK